MQLEPGPPKPLASSFPLVHTPELCLAFIHSWLSHPWEAHDSSRICSARLLTALSSSAPAPIAGPRFATLVCGGLLLALAGSRILSAILGDPLGVFTASEVCAHSWRL